MLDAINKRKHVQSPRGRLVGGEVSVEARIGANFGRPAGISKITLRSIRLCAFGAIGGLEDWCGRERGRLKDWF